jgi:hypothetical protein
MKKLNPFDAVRREAERKAQEERHKKRVAAAKTNRKDKAIKAGKAKRNANFKALQDGLTDKYKKADDEIAAEDALDIMAEESEEDE